MSTQKFDGELFEQCLQLASQCWCDVETCTQTIDTMLCEAIAKRLYVLAVCGKAEGNLCYLVDGNFEQTWKELNAKA